MRLRIRQTIENRKWVYHVQRRRWFLWFNASDPLKTKGEAREALLTLRTEYEYGGVKPWIETALQ
jgi:hypothetical protein